MGADTFVSYEASMCRALSRSQRLGLAGFQFVVDIFGVEHLTGLGIDNQIWPGPTRPLATTVSGS